ncbi:hypothetical protein ACIGO9_31310 [Nocardia asteroides]|uniref:hypothetical protein n=1 Tax=Nocardia asteroides TaxID=1824 RepID=UPI0037C6FA87
MLGNPPKEVDGATVELFAFTRDAHATRATRHSEIENPDTEVAALAIAKYEGSSDYYLFYCNEAWVALTDTWHPSLESAIDQANYEFSGLTFTAP